MNDASQAEPLVPTALREFGCTLSKSGSVVRIDCDNGDDANEVFDWLSTIVDTIAEMPPKTTT